MRGISRQNAWLGLAIVTGAGLAVLATLAVVGEARREALDEEVRAKTREAASLARKAQGAANRARRAREEAEDLVGFFLTELQTELEPLGRVDLSESAALRAVAYYDALPPELVTVETRTNRAAVLRQLAWSRHSRGDAAGAVRAIESCVAEARELMELASDRRSMLTLADILQDYGQLLLANQDGAGARTIFFEALAVLDRTPQGEVADVISRKGTVYSGLGEVGRFGLNGEAALKDYRKAIELLEQVAETRPDDPAVLSTLLHTHSNLGWIKMTFADPDGAEVSLLSALEVARRIKSLSLADRSTEQSLATILDRLGQALHKKNEFPRAVKFLREARSMREALVTWDPRNARWLADLARSHQHLADLHFDLNEFEEALAEARRSLDLFAQLVIRQPDTEAWTTELDKTLEGYRTRLRRAGREEAALALHQEALAMADTLQGSSSGRNAWENLLADLQGDLSRLGSEVGDHRTAIAGALASAATAARAYTRLPAASASAYELALSYSELGIAHRENGDSPEAALCFALCRYLLAEQVEDGFRNREMYLEEAERDQRLALQEAGVWQAPDTLVPAGAVWKFFDRWPIPAENWNAPGFDDSSWQSGPAKLGYGAGDEATRIGFGDDLDHKHITAWFRRSFQLDDPSSIQSLQFNLLRDDGAVVYLNGREVLRDGLPPGPLTPKTVANVTTMRWAERIYRIHRIPARDLLLLPGRNILAVEVHQNEPPSSDLAFDLEVLRNHRPPPLLEGFDPKLAPTLLGEALPPALQARLTPP